MLEELERRNYSPLTTCAYLRAVDEFARYFKRPPNQLGPDHIRQSSGVSVSRTKALTQQRYPAARRITVLLYQVGRIAMSCSARIYWKPCASTGAASGANPR